MGLETNQTVRQILLKIAVQENMSLFRIPSAWKKLKKQKPACLWQRKVPSFNKQVRKNVALKEWSRSQCFFWTLPLTLITFSSFLCWGNEYIEFTNTEVGAVIYITKEISWLPRRFDFLILQAFVYMLSSFQLFETPGTVAMNTSVHGIPDEPPNLLLPFPPSGIFPTRDQTQAHFCPGRFFNIEPPGKQE